MSGQATGWVLRHGPKERAMRLVLLTIADAANRDGAHAHPGLDAIIEGSLYRRSHVLETLVRLQEEGWLEVEQEGRGRGHATVYRVRMDVSEKVRLADSPQDEKGPILDEKRSVPDDEKVQSTEPSLYGSTVSHNGVNHNDVTRGAQEPLDATSFDDFWEVYPRKTAKGAARKAWAAAVKAAGGGTAIVDGARRFAADPNRVDQFTPHASTWLNAERWGDDPLPPRLGPVGQIARARIDTNRDGPSGVVSDEELWGT